MDHTYRYNYINHVHVFVYDFIVTQKHNDELNPEKKDLYNIKLVPVNIVTLENKYKTHSLPYTQDLNGKSKNTGCPLGFSKRSMEHDHFFMNCKLISPFPLKHNKDFSIMKIFFLFHKFI